MLVILVNLMLIKTSLEDPLRFSQRQIEELCSLLIQQSADWNFA